MATKNYYEILGVDRKATAADIKSAYRKLVKQYHPDLHPGDAAAAAKRQHSPIGRPSSHRDKNAP